MGSCFQPSGSQIAASTPVGGISCIPDGKGTKYCQLAAHLGHLTHLLHLHGVAKVGEQAFVPEVDEAPGANLERKVGSLEAIALDGGLEVVVSVRFPLQGSTHVGRGVPGDSQLDQGHLRGVGLPVDDHQVGLLGCHGDVGGDGHPVDPLALKVGIQLSTFQPLGSKLF